MKKPQPSSTPQPTRGQVFNAGNFMLSLVIPCYNESKRVEIMLAGLSEFDDQWNGKYEVIIVDDGSKDDCVAKIREAVNSRFAFLQDKLHIEQLAANGGKGNALKKGVSIAKGDYVLTLDADMSTKPTELINWQKKEKDIFSQQDTVYIGSRRHHEGKVEALQSRKLIGGVFNGIVQILTTLHLKDTQCGFKLYPRNVASFLFDNMQSKGWSHDVELLYQADLNDISIKEMPINWVNQPESKVHVVKDSFMMFIGVLSISLRIWFYNSFVLPFRIPDTVTPDQKKHIRYRAIFNCIALLLLIAMPLMSFQYAITGDEHWHHDYGDSVFNYFFHHDNSIQTATSGIQYYGGIFDFITASTYHLFHIWDHYTTMHFINALVGAVGIIYAGKLGKLLGGWSAGILTMIFLVLSPSWFGHNFANPKDIPFSMGYTAGIYFILLYLKALPNPSIKHIFGLICSIGWAMGVRIGGLLLIVYLVMFVAAFAILTGQVKTIVNKRLIRQLVIVGVIGYLIAIICWPYAHLNIITKPLESLKIMSNFFINIGLLYDGKKILSNQVPWYYIPRYIWYTAPIVVLVGFALGCIGVLYVYRKNRTYLLFSLFILFACIFPVFYAIYKKSSLYDGWRHFLFIYPMMVVVAAAGWMFIVRSKQKAIRYATIALIALGLFSPVQYVAAYHPFESLYYNEIAGGLKNIYGRYETDYYMLGIKPATEWLVKNEHLENSKATIATNCSYPVIEYLKPYKGLSAVYVRYYERYQKDWDYCILFSRFVDAAQLTTGNWPSAEVIHTINVQGVPIAAVLKRKTHKDFAGFELMKAKKSEEAKAMFWASLQEYPTNDLVWEALAEIYGQEGKPDSVLYAGRQALKTYPSDITVHEIMGNAFMAMRKPDSAIALYNNLVKYNPTYGHLFLGYAYATLGNANQAFMEVDNAIEADPYNQGAYKLGIQLAQQTHNNAKAEDYYDKVKKAFPDAE